MKIRVVCISPTDGSNGHNVAPAVAEQLGYRYVNEEIIAEAARLAQIDPAIVAATEQRQSLMDRILERLAAAQDALGVGAFGRGSATSAQDPDARPATRDDLRSMIRAAILEIGKAGDAVIAAHAASYALAGDPSVLRVLITAPSGTRRARLLQERRLLSVDADDAIEAGDRGRAEYLKSFYGIDEELPTHYDLVLNTQFLDSGAVTSTILAAVRG